MNEQVHGISLDGQVGIVTGGGRGIGREIALHLARAGMKVAVTARTESQLTEVVDTITGEGGFAIARVMDVRDASAVRDAIASVVQEWGPVDLLVNNAGIAGEAGLPWEQDLDDWWRVLEVNLKGALCCSRAVLPSMVARRRGRIINVGSNAGFIDFPEDFPVASAYSVSKAALTRLGELLADCTGSRGVQVFTISPGLVRTEMTSQFHQMNQFPDDAWTPVEAAARLCLLLASGRADVLNGRYIHARSDNVDEMMDRLEDIGEKRLYRLGMPHL